MPRLDIAVLGPPQIRLDGQLVETDRRKAIALLAYLAVTGQAHTREALIELLWPGYARESATAYLRRTLWELNQRVGKGWLDADRDQVTLIASPDLWRDTVEFQHAAQAEDIATLTQAAALYRGDFLAGFSVADTAPFEAWQRQQAEYHRRELAQVLEKLAHAHSQNGAYAAALPTAHRWLALDPLNESAHRMLMRLFSAQGERASAIRQYTVCAQTLKTELGLEPQPETTELYQLILRGEPFDDGLPTARDSAQGAHRPVSQLPGLPTPFIGRRPEVEQVKALVQSPQHRLVTLTGPGGTGKTRLSIQVASEIAETFADRVYFVPLAPVPSAEDVLPALAQTLHFTFYREEESPRQQLLDYVREKHLLLILDNFEHVLDASALVADILTHAAQVKIIITSRVRLNLPGEQLYPVSGMRVPGPAEAMTWDDPEAQAQPFSAVQLFLDRARRVQPAFALTKTNASAVLQICQLVQGMPLALELAAAWMELLSPADIATEIARSLDFLETDQASVPDRQRSLRAVFDSSWNLLSAEEQTAFLRLTVCVGSFSREAAQRISAASLRTLLKLADKSWLQAVAGGRFQLHELMRQYGAERLQADAAAWRAAKQQHAEYFADFMAEQTRALWSAQQVTGLKALDEEFASNLHAAWEWLVAERQWSIIIEKILGGLYTYGNIRNRMDILLAWFRIPRQMLDAQAADHEVSARAILGTIEVSAEESLQIKDDNPIERLTRLWALAQTHHLAEPMGFWFVMLAGLVLARNVDPAAQTLLEDAVGRMRRQNEPYLLGISLLMQSGTGGDFSFDEAKIREAERLFRELGVIHEQGVVAWLQGQRAGQQKRPPAEIIQLVNRSQAFFEQTGRPLTSNVLLLAGMYIQQQQLDELFAHFHRDEQAMEQLGNLRFLGSLLQWESLYAARYSTFAHALDARQRGLALAQKANVQSDVVFQHFELGDIYRIFGQPDEAQVWYAQARAGFEKMGFILGLAYCERAHGDLALAAGRYAEALTHYQTFMRYAQQDNHTWSMGQAHAKLALTHAHLNNLVAARSDMRLALTEMRAWGQDEIELQALLAEVVCLLQEQQPEPAAELAAFIAQHHISWNETKQHARALLETATRALPAERAPSVIERGQALTLEAVIDTKLIGFNPSP